VSLSSVTTSFKHNETVVACDFSLFNLENQVAGIARAVPARHLSPSDDRSLIIRHHRSDSLAIADFQGVEDMDPDQPCAKRFRSGFGFTPIAVAPDPRIST
jgi:hypothetical protein